MPYISTGAAECVCHIAEQTASPERGREGHGGYVPYPSTTQPLLGVKSSFLTGFPTTIILNVDVNNKHFFIKKMICIRNPQFFTRWRDLEHTNNES